MATSTTVSTAGVFANGATVGAYPVSNWPNGIVNQSAAPVGSATATGTVSNGSVTINSLTTNTEYVLAVSGGTRYLSVSTRDYTPGRQTTSADIGDGEVHAVDVAADVATQAELDAVNAAKAGKELGYAELTANPGDSSHTRSSVTLADVTGLSTTVTVGTRPVVVRFEGQGFHGTAGQGTGIAIVEGVTARKFISVTSGSANALVNLGCEVRLAPAAGSVTFKIQLSSSNTSAASLILGTGANYKASIHVVEC